MGFIRQIYVFRPWLFPLLIAIRLSDNFFRPTWVGQVIRDILSDPVDPWLLKGLQAVLLPEPKACIFAPKKVGPFRCHTKGNESQKGSPQFFGCQTENWGRWFPFWRAYFSDGWFNHQLGKMFTSPEVFRKTDLQEVPMFLQTALKARCIPWLAPRFHKNSGFFWGVLLANKKDINIEWMNSWIHEAFMILNFRTMTGLRFQRFFCFDNYPFSAFWYWKFGLWKI